MKHAKKLTALALSLTLGLSLLPVMAQAAPNTVTAQIPSYDCLWWQRGDLPIRAIDYKNSQYPLLNYKDITYFPMTWDYCNLMNLASVWVEGEGLLIAYHPDYARPEQAMPTYQTVQNTRWNTAQIPTYPVYLNGKQIPVDAEYPILNFRDVTYFPMTWEYAHDAFGWDLSFIVDGKNNQFTINSFHAGTTFDYMDVVEEAEDGAVIFVQHTVPVRTDSETVTYDYQNVYEKLSFADGSLTPLPDYKNDAPHDRKTVDRSDELSIQGKNITLGGVILDEIGYLVDGSETVDSLHLRCGEWQENGATFAEISVYAKWDEIPAPYTPHEDFLYLKQGDRYTLITKDVYADRVEVFGDDVYVDTIKRTGFRGTHYLAHVLYKISTDGTVTNLTSTDSNHGSLKLLGKCDRGIVVEGLWAPEQQASDVVSDYHENLSVSPYNDGFFLYDGANFSLLHRYTFSTGAIVSPQGDIYLMNGYREGSITKLQ